MLWFPGHPLKSLHGEALDDFLQSRVPGWGEKPSRSPEGSPPPILKPLLSPLGDPRVRQELEPTAKLGPLGAVPPLYHCA